MRAAARVARVARGEAAGDTIVVSALRKVYAGGKVAVRSLSFGLPLGAFFGWIARAPGKNRKPVLAPLLQRRESADSTL